MAQYALKLSDGLYEEIKTIAKRQNKSSRELIIMLLKMGLIALEAHNNPNKELIFRESNSEKVTEKTVMILWIHAQFRESNNVNYPAQGYGGSQGAVREQEELRVCS